MTRNPHRRRPNYNPGILWHPGMGKCSQPPHKRSYPSRKAAAKAQAVHGGSYYRCRACGDYHLTSYPPNVQRAITLLTESLRDDRRKALEADYARRGIPIPR
jgi:hypothetical protein